MFFADISEKQEIFVENKYSRIIYIAKKEEEHSR